MIHQSMVAYSHHLESSLIQLPAMMRKGSQAMGPAGQAHNTVINGAGAKEIGHIDRAEEDKRKAGKVRVWGGRRVIIC